MNTDSGTSGKHEPSSEFRARLTDELERGLERARLFGPVAAPPLQTWRVAKVFAIAAGALLTLLTGIVVGVSVSYASAAVPDTPRPSLAMLPIKTINAFRCPAPPSMAQTSTAAPQQAVAVVDLSPPTARSAETLGGVLGLKEASDGRVLVNDAKRRQLRLFAPSLATSTVMLDSAMGSATSYGERGGPLMPYVGDSSLMFDSRTDIGMMVLDGQGQIARAMALLSSDDIGQWYRNPIGVDAKGNIVYRYQDTTSFFVHYPPGPIAQGGHLRGGGGGGGADGGGGRGRGGDGGGGRGSPGTNLWLNYARDTVPIRRANFATRGYDTVGFVVQPPVLKIVPVKGKEETPEAAIEVINPLPTVDVWAVLSDGTVAFVRGHDYHVDWVHPDGSKSSSPKLPFDWKRLTDDDKQHLVDSVRAAQDSVPRYRGPSWDGPAPPSYREWPYEIVPLSQIADYWPPFSSVSSGVRGAGGRAGRGAGRGAAPTRGQISEQIRAQQDGIRGAAIADRDGNLWVLPRSSASKNGELVYDVVNPKQGFVRHVRIPLGRSIAGFGKGGVVYLQAGDVTNGFTLERTTVPGVKTSTPKPH